MCEECNQQCLLGCTNGVVSLLRTTAMKEFYMLLDTAQRYMYMYVII